MLVDRLTFLSLEPDRPPYPISLYSYSCFHAMNDTSSRMVDMVRYHPYQPSIKPAFVYCGTIDICTMHTTSPSLPHHGPKVNTYFSRFYMCSINSFPRSFYSDSFALRPRLPGVSWAREPLHIFQQGRCAQKDSFPCDETVTVRPAAKSTSL